MKVRYKESASLPTIAAVVGPVCSQPSMRVASAA
jgi:hypothetical protein